MALLAVSGIEKSYGALEVLRGVTFSVGEGDRTAVVGPNGCGKTTLLRIIMGFEPADAGSVSLLPDREIGALPQEVTRLDGVDVLSAVLFGQPRLAELERLLHDLERQMDGSAEGESESRADGNDTAEGGGRPGGGHDVLDESRLEELIARYGEAQAEFDRLGGHEADARAKTILAGLGFAGADLHKSVRVLSGGQRTRVYLARLLFQEPHLLVLDEPTNHLDLEAVEWLEEYLLRWKGTILLVSHDRAFLDRVADHVVDLHEGRSTAYRGNYSDYARQKAFNDSQQLEAYERQQEEIKRLQAYVDRYRAGNRSRQAKSRENRLRRMDRIERPRGPGEVRFRFAPSHASGREALMLERVGKAYGDLRLFDRFDLFVGRGDRVGVVGPNGAGKSTFLRCLMDEESFDAGNVYLGHNVQIGTMGQQAEELDEENSVLEELMENAAITVSDARDLLAQFSFVGDDVFKPVGAISGGERNRLLLARLLASRPNMLLLDEPTNHLDLWCRQALEKALIGYPGTVIFASHDRYLLRSVATRILEIRGGRARIFNLTWDEYREKAREAAGTGAAPAAAKKPAAGGKSSAPARKAAGGGRGASPGGARGPSSGGTKRVSSGGTRGPSSRAERNAAEKQRKRVEREIEALEERVADLTRRLGDPSTYENAAEARGLSDDYEESNRRLRELYAEWEEMVSEASV